jgi:DUF1680 family protein
VGGRTESGRSAGHRCKAAGEKTDGPFNGTWDEANLYKFLERIAHSLGMFPDAALEQKVGEIVELIGRAQRKNGYAHVFIINEGKPDPAWWEERLYRNAGEAPQKAVAPSPTEKDAK